MHGISRPGRALKFDKGRMDASVITEAQAAIEKAALLDLSSQGIDCFAAVKVTPRYLVFSPKIGTFNRMGSESELGDWISGDRIPSLSERVALRIVACVLQSLFHLHSQGWVHGFLEPCAVEVFVPALAIATRSEHPPGHRARGLSNLDEGDAFARDRSVRIGRFPLLRKIFLHVNRDDFPLAAPEVVGGTMIGTAADVWSVGTLLRYLCRDGALSAAASDLVSRCTAIDPNARPTIADIAAHPAFLMNTGSSSRSALSSQAMVEILRRRKRQLGNAYVAWPGSHPPTDDVQSSESESPATSEQSSDTTSETTSDADDESDVE